MISPRSLRGIAITFIVAVSFIPKHVRAQQSRGIDAVLHAFEKHSIVLLGEMHWNAQQHRFIQMLLHDPRFASTVNDVAVEFGNSLYQPILDRYVAGETVPPDSLKMVWRNTTQPMAWDRPIYADIYVTIRQLNRKLPSSRRMRVIALDPPIEWNTVKTMADFPRIWGYRDPLWFTTLDKEVLTRNRKVLVIAGGLHILKTDPPHFTAQPFDRLGLGDALNQRYASATYRIYPASGEGALGRSMKGKKSGTMVPVAGTVFGARSSQMLWPSGVTMFRKVNGKTEPFTLDAKDYPPIGSLIDAIMYYGPDTSSSPLPTTQYADCAYVAELRRRNEILLPVFGLDQSPTLDSLAARGHGRCATH